MNGKRKKTRYRPEHNRMLNDRRWPQTKAIVWQRAGGQCEWCRERGRAEGRRTGDEDLARDGYIVPGVDCHHLVPFESAKTQAEMERLCYSPDNCVLLCVPCHIKAHTQMGSKTKEAVQARRAERFERWKDKIRGNANGTTDDDQSL